MPFIGCAVVNVTGACAWPSDAALDEVRESASAAHSAQWLLLPEHELGFALQKAAGYGGIKLVQMKGSDSDWMGMTNKYGAAWEVPVTPNLPWDFRIVSDDSQEVNHSISWSAFLNEVCTVYTAEHGSCAKLICCLQVTAFNLINKNGVTGDVPTNVQFKLIGGGPPTSSSSVSSCFALSEPFAQHTRRPPHFLRTMLGWRSCMRGA
jgi:hypothetical protein